jgi:hypothetical protein
MTSIAEITKPTHSFKYSYTHSFKHHNIHNMHGIDTQHNIHTTSHPYTSPKRKHVDINV